MTLTEFKYIVALARERHFGRAARSCFVSQHTLSVAVRKLEDELGVTLFERGMSDVSVTPIGEQVVVQAKRVLEEATAIRQMVHKGKEQLNGSLRIGAIYTIAPYLFPRLIPVLHDRAPLMPRSKSVTPSSSSSFLTATLRVGWLTKQDLAALPKCRSRANATMYLNSVSVMVPLAEPIQRTYQNCSI